MRTYWMNTIEGPQIPVLMVKPGLTLADVNTINEYADAVGQTGFGIGSPSFTQDVFESTDEELYEFMTTKSIGNTIQGNIKLSIPFADSYYNSVAMELRFHPDAVPVWSDEFQLSRIDVAVEDRSEKWLGRNKSLAFSPIMADGNFTDNPYEMTSLDMGRFGNKGITKFKGTTAVAGTHVLIRDDTGNMETVEFFLGTDSTKPYYTDLVMMEASTIPSQRDIDPMYLPSALGPQQTGTYEETATEPEPETQTIGCFVNVSQRFSPRQATSGTGIYPINKTQLSAFTADMWTTNFAEKWISTINGNPVDNIITMRWYYGILADIARIDVDTYVTLGNTAFDGSFGTATTLITKPAASEYVQIDCGNIRVPRRFNNFLDYSPFTTLEIYIPFIGYVTLDMTEFIGKDIRLIYSLNLVTGGCIAHVYAEKPEGWRMIMEIQGSMGVEIPFTVNARESISSRLATSAAGAAAAGLGFAAMAAAPVVAAGAGAGALGAMTNAIQPMQLESGNFRRGGGLDSETSSMACFRPYIRITSPVAVAPSDYDEHIGRPDFRSGKVGDFNGYMKIGAIKSTNSTNSVPREALAEIESLLKGGVYSV